MIRMQFPISTGSGLMWNVPIPIPSGHSRHTFVMGFRTVCNGRYVLQTDCDAIIVRSDRSHQYLRDMRNALEDDDVLSVSFNIAHDPEKPKADYSGFFCP